jgi:hypothetical protein
MVWWRSYPGILETRKPDEYVLAFPNGQARKLFGAGSVPNSPKVMRRSR